MTTDGVTSNSILRVVNMMVAPQQMQYIAVFFATSGRITFETGATVSAEAGVALRQEIYQTLDAQEIVPINNYANSLWTKWVIHGVSAEIGTTNTTETCTKLAQEIQRTSDVILAQLARWLTRQEVLNETGRGTIVVSFPGNVVNIG